MLSTSLRPPSSHATFAIMAMKAGKPVYIEKPMAASYEDCARINRISQETGVPCFVAYYRRYLPYFQKVRQMVENGEIGNVINIQIRFAQPPRNLDYNSTNLPWRVQADIAGGGYFYDLAPHQLDLLQDMFGCILEAEGYKSNRGGLYQAEDTISACFKFDSGLPGSGSWCFVAHESAKEDRIEIIGDKGMICFSVFTYEPIALHTERGREEFLPENPPHVQLPLIKAVVEHLQGKAICTCDGISATPTNWVMDRILNNSNITFMTNARKICLLLSFFLYILNASAQEEIKKDTTAQNSKGVLVNLTDGFATTVRHTGRKIRKVGKEFNAVDTTFISPNLYNLAFMLEHSSWYEYYRLGSNSNNGEQSISFSPNANFKLGVYFGWRWIFLGYSFDVKDIFGGHKNKAKKTEMALNLYSSKFGVDLYWRKTGSDFKIRSYNGFQLNTPTKNMDFNGFQSKIRG